MEPTIWIFLIAFGLTALRSLAQFLMIDQRKIKIYRNKIEKWQKLRDKAQKEQNPRLLRKVESQKSRIQRFQEEIAKATWKPMCLFFLPFLVVFWAIQILFPNPIPTGFGTPQGWFLSRFFASDGLKPTWYYVLANIASNTLVTVIFQLLGLIEKTPGGMGMGMGGGR
ncbi:MAG: DUF106 domain-containing protein [Candidatus Korarchaeota archaeon]|nr:DUF106 domain-containing protein [Candidatus Korarchaeota archaeon]NIU82712.1 DUF106 domain-containing protein [Candidatus Thorarchaeota archaeon]NIW13203.1 DUF106 domain-containing protein [Candidatus Thorarchaeota archaeon]NIW51342.1 DUF106 domain-containing protein [Candidatus Korarchaeota archaeon]